MMHTNTMKLLKLVLDRAVELDLRGVDFGRLVCSIHIKGGTIAMHTEEIEGLAPDRLEHALNTALGQFRKAVALREAQQTEVPSVSVLDGSDTCGCPTCTERRASAAAAKSATDLEREFN